MAKPLIVTDPWFDGILLMIKAEFSAHEIEVELAKHGKKVEDLKTFAIQMDGNEDVFPGLGEWYRGYEARAARSGVVTEQQKAMGVAAELHELEHEGEQPVNNWLPSQKPARSGIFGDSGKLADLSKRINNKKE